MRIFLLCLVLLCFPKPLLAGTGSGLLIVMSVDQTSSGPLFRFTLPVSANRPACATSGAWIVDPNSRLAAEQMSLLKLAFTLGKPVNVVGFNTCTISGGLPENAEVVGNVQLIQ